MALCVSRAEKQWPGRRPGLLRGALMLALAGGLIGPGSRGETAAVVVLNRGAGGNTSRDGLRRFSRDVVAAHPAHVVLYFGINDALNSAKLVPVDEFRRNLGDMVERARAGGARTVVLITPNPIVAEYVTKRHPKHPEPDLAAHLALYDAAIRAVAADKAAVLADLGAWIRDRGVPAAATASVIRNLANCGSADGVHLTAMGYRLMGEKLAAILSPRVKAGDRIVCFGDSITYGAHMPGAGTAEGDTYPAWLWHFLNRTSGDATGDGSLEAPAADNGKQAL